MEDRILEFTIYQSGGGCQTTYGKLTDGNYFACMLFEDISIYDADYTEFMEIWNETDFANAWLDEHKTEEIKSNEKKFYYFYEELCWKALSDAEVGNDAKIECKRWLKDYYQEVQGILEENF